MCDPWFTGAAFDHGWRLLAEDSHDLDAQSLIGFGYRMSIPDHFSVPTLKQLRAVKASSIKRPRDGKVRDYLRDKGHEVSEIGDFETRGYGDIDVQLFVSDGYDSAAMFTLPDGRKVLNLNDARVELGGLLERIAAAAGAIDLLTVQFSYANWAGNAGDDAIPRYQHQQVLDRVERVITTLKPTATLLFASYVYFSHEENFHWNAHFWLDQVVARLAPLTKLIVPKPNDGIDLTTLQSADFSVKNEAARRLLDRLARQPKTGRSCWRTPKP